MKKISKLLSVFMTAVLLTALLPDFLVFRAGASVSGDFKYDIYYREWVMITGYNGDDDIVTVPELICGKPVRGIGKSSFKGTDVSKVVLPSSVRCIYADAFKDCTELEEIDFGENLQTVYNSFQNTAIKNIKFPTSLKTIGGNTFSGNNCLEKIIFDGTYSKKFNVYGSFENGFGCPSAQIVINCTPSVEVDLLLTNAQYMSEETDGVYTYSFSESGFDVQEYTNGAYSYFLDEKNNAVINNFNDYNAVSVSIPEVLDGHTVTGIADYAFCSFSVDGNEWNDVVRVSDLYSFRSIVLPDTLKSIGKYAFAFNNELSEIDIPSSVESIGYCAFSECTQFQTVEIPQNLAVISDYAFAGCKFESITIPDGIVSVCQNAFDFSNIDNTEISLPDSIEYIGENAFGENSFMEIKLPENLIELDASFRNSEYLERVEFNDKLVRMSGTFEGCTQLKEAELPDSLTAVGDYTFADCTSLEKVHMSSNVARINEGAFYGCTSLNRFDWDSPVKNIESNAFCECSISEFDFSCTDSVPSGAFQESGITSVKIGENKENSEIKQTIGSYGFYGCENLTTAAIGGNVNEISSKSFASCPNLETVVIADSVEAIADDAFDDSDNITIVCTAGSYALNYAQANNIRVTTLVIAPISNQVYTGKQIKPKLNVSVSEKQLNDIIDYSVSYSDNVNVGTASAVVSGRGDYSMLVSKAEFAVTPRYIDEATVIEIPEQSLDGKKCCPKLTVIYKGKTLKNGEDYSVTYSNNTRAGTGTAMVKGLGNFMGNTEVKFIIKEDEIPKAKQFIVYIWNLFIGFINSLKIK